MEVTTQPPIVNTLHCNGDLTQESEFDTREADLLTLEICHLDAQFSHQKMINVGSIGCRKAAG